MAQNQALPAPSLPLVDPRTGQMSPVWFQFFNSLWQRTGGGSSEGSVQSVSVNSGSGIISSVGNPTTAATINLTLGSISPTAVQAQGPVTGTTGQFPGGLSTLGPMQFGSFVLGTITANGYISIIDVNGNTRKLMVGI